MCYCKIYITCINGARANHAQRFTDLFFNLALGVAIQGDNVRRSRNDEFPFAVAIGDVDDGVNSMPRSSRQFCTGSLITKKYVLTAEHCLLTKTVPQVEVLAGSINLDLCKAYAPQKWTTWQEWKYNDSNKFPPYEHDVAIITLKNCITEPYMSPARLPRLNSALPYGTTVKMAGWGLTSANVKPKILRTVSLKVLTNANCESELSQLAKEYYPVAEWELCTTSEPWALNGCGDSGGPLLNKRGYIIGITMGSCPDETTIADNYPRQVIFMNRLMERRVNLHASIHYYRDFVTYFTKESPGCSADN